VAELAAQARKITRLEAPQPAQDFIAHAAPQIR
jgi:hypothetical protein